MSDELVTMPPSGVRDLGPSAAASVFSVQRALLDVMRRHGFERVMTPSFDVVEALTIDGREPSHGLFRFVDPESGGVVALRDDVTPQVARLVATRLDAADAPFRLCYSARVYRRRSHFGIAPRELIQAGAELIGAGGLGADLQILEVAVRCLQALELSGDAATTFSLAHTGVLRGLLVAVADELGNEVAANVERLCRRRSLVAVSEALAAQPLMAATFRAVLLGDIAAAEASIHQVSPASGEALEALKTLSEAARERLPQVRWCLDLAADRGFDYYTGMSFMGLMDGVGRPLLSGGRYDDLVGRFGPEMPAVGFVVDEQAVLEGLARCGRSTVIGTLDVLVVERGHAAGEGNAAVDRLIDMLRSDGGGAHSVVRSISPQRWGALQPEALNERLAARRFRSVVFVDPEGFELVERDGQRRLLRTLDEVVHAVGDA